MTGFHRTIFEHANSSISPRTWLSLTKSCHHNILHDQVASVVDAVCLYRVTLVCSVPVNEGLHSELADRIGLNVNHDISAQETVLSEKTIYPVCLRYVG